MTNFIEFFFHWFARIKIEEARQTEREKEEEAEKSANSDTLCHEFSSLHIEISRNSCVD